VVGVVNFAGQQPIELQGELNPVPLDYQALARSRWQRKKLYLHSLAMNDEEVPFITLQRLTRQEYEEVIEMHYDTIYAFNEQQSLLLPIIRKVQEQPTAHTEDILTYEENKVLRAANRKMQDIYDSLLEAMIVEPQRYTHGEVVTIYNSLSREEQDQLNQLMQIQLAAHAGQATLAARRMQGDNSQFQKLLADSGVPL